MPKNCNFIEKLREVGLRPTKQRVNMCEVLFNREKTFHFTINDLVKMISEKMNQKISLATVYNTVHAFEKKGYLKEISIDSHKSYFDTNTSAHHHFFDEDTHELIDCDESDIDKINIRKNITGKKINSVEVLVRVASDNQTQKYINSRNKVIENTFNRSNKIYSKIEELQKRIADKYGYKLVDHKLELYGIKKK